MSAGRIIYPFQRSGYVWRISLDREILWILSCVADSLAFLPCYLVVIPTVGWGWEMICVCVYVCVRVVGVTVGFYLCCCVGISLNVLESYHRMCVCCARCFILSVELQRPLYQPCSFLSSQYSCIVYYSSTIKVCMTGKSHLKYIFIKKCKKQRVTIKIISYLYLIKRI
jgi:hypothetical protein